MAPSDESCRQTNAKNGVGESHVSSIDQDRNVLSEQEEPSTVESPCSSEQKPFSTREPVVIGKRSDYAASPGRKSKDCASPQHHSDWAAFKDTLSAREMLVRMNRSCPLDV